jgi:hypothetical protein
MTGIKGVVVINKQSFAISGQTQRHRWMPWAVATSASLGFTLQWKKHNTAAAVFSERMRVAFI